MCLGYSRHSSLFHMTHCSSSKMDVCTIGMLVFLCLLSTLKTVIASVNTCRYPKVKPTTQSSNHSWEFPSSKAVDGCTKQIFIQPWCCSHTKSGQEEAWWQVDLEELIVMEYVNIYYRDDGFLQKRRFGGYQIYQSSTWDWWNGNRCYRDTTSTAGNLLLTPKIRCTGTGQYLTIYSDRRSGGLSWYSNEAVLELCEVEVYGCPLGSFGNGTCDSKCDTGCTDSLCDPVTGECNSCIPGKYGSYCNEACPFKCKDNRCIQSNGTCEDCEDGFFGSSCDQCSDGCTDPVCDKRSGECSLCIPGYYGSHCNQTCPFKCKDNRCIQSNGKCEDCEDGFFGSSCDQCSDGCTDPVCDKRSGECSPCIPGYYGSHCNQICPSKCKDNRCIQSNGKCADCDDGFFGSSCCGCSVGCFMRVCNKTSGTCSPCTPGHFGNTCNTICPSNCKENKCNQTSGLCTVVNVPSEGEDFNPAAIGIGISSGVVIVVMAVVIIVLVRRKQSRSFSQRDTTRSTTMTDISLMSIENKLRTETDDPYYVIDAKKGEGSAVKKSPYDEKYEHLGPRDVEVPHT